MASGKKIPAQQLVEALQIVALKHKYAQTVQERPAKAFARQYYRDPVAFVHDCFVWPEGQGPTPYQEEIMASLMEHPRICVRAPHGAGKSALMSQIILWFALSRDAAERDWKIPTTASAWRQLTKFLWPEVRKWSRRIRWDKVGREPFNPRTEQLVMSLNLQYGEAFAAASDTPEYLEGAHADSLLYIFDEAKTVIPATFDAAEGAFAGAGKDTANEAFAIVASTPGEPVGRFYDIQARKPGYSSWFCRHITLEECIASGRVSREWAEEKALQWGILSSVYLNRVRGEFADAGSEGIIPLSWVEKAIERWHEWAEKTHRKFDKINSVGVDVAAGGVDKTVMALREGMRIVDLREYSKADTMQTVGRVVGVLDGHGGVSVVDVNGIGSGVVSRLREQNKPVIAFNGAERTDERDRSRELGFANKRAAAYWKFKELLDPSYGSEVALPPNDTMIGDLTAPHLKRIDSSGKILIEAKEDIVSRLGRSPDYGDAIVMAFYEGATLSLPFGWLRQKLQEVVG